MRYDPPFHRTPGLIPAIIVIALLIAAPLLIQTSYVRHLLILAFIFAMVAASWDLSFGYGGLLNFAHVALFAVGIYTYAIFAKTLGVNPWLAILLAGPVAMLFASIMVLPVLRLDGMYVILVTIAFSQILYQLVISQSDITGGTSGMVTLPALSIDGYRFTKNQKIGYYYTALALLTATAAALYMITRSRLGRSIIALRDNKYFAMSRGISEWKIRLLTLTTSAFFAGIAGGFYGSYVRVASPDIFGIGSLTLVLSMLLVGGVATLWGPVLAAFLIILLSESMANWGPWREIVTASLIILVMIFYPGGLWGVVQELREGVQKFFSASLAKWHRYVERAQRQRRLGGVTENIISTPHGSIAVADTGLLPTQVGPPLLLLHGNSACKEAFHHQFKYFGERHRVIAFDLPGHGVSDNGDPECTYNIIAYADIAEHIIKHLGIEKPVVLGWSLGGYNALELVARAPENYNGLVITGTAPLTMAPDDFARGHNARSHLVLAGKQYFTYEEARLFASHATAPYSKQSRFLHKNLKRTDGRARFYMLSKLSIINWPRQMQLLTDGTIPVAVLNGDNDPFLNHQYIADIDYGNIWRGAPTDIKDGRHAPFFNQPVAFNGELQAYIEWAVSQQQNQRSGEPAI